MEEQKNIQIENVEQTNENVPANSRTLSIIMITIFLVVLSLPTLLWGGMKLLTPSYVDKLDFDTGENRKKAEFPKEVNLNKFSSQVENWYNDNLPFRSLLYKLQSNGKQSLEKVYNYEIYPWLVSFSNNSFPLRFNNLSQKVVYGKGDWLFYGAERSLEYYMATNILSDEKMQEMTQILSELKTICDSRGIELRIMFAPNKEQIYSEYMPNLLIEDYNKRIDRLVEYIRANSNVGVVYPKQELLNAKKEAQLYYKYDTHWNFAGAYIGVQALYSSLGIESIPWAELTKTQYTRSNGDLLNMGDIDVTKYTQDTDYSVKYRPDITVSSTQGIILGTNGSSQTIHTKSSSERMENLVLIGDSFRSGMKQYLQADFASTTITHRNHLEAADVKEAILNADVLVICAVERYDEKLINDAKKILDFLKQNS